VLEELGRRGRDKTYHVIHRRGPKETTYIHMEGESLRHDETDFRKSKMVIAFFCLLCPHKFFRDHNEYSRATKSACSKALPHSSWPTTSFVVLSFIELNQAEKSRLSCLPSMTMPASTRLMVVPMMELYMVGETSHMQMPLLESFQMIHQEVCLTVERLADSRLSNLTSIKSSMEQIRMHFVSKDGMGPSRCDQNGLEAISIVHVIFPLTPFRLCSDYGNAIPIASGHSNAANLVQGMLGKIW
jgi:hypothetical protein